MAQGKDTKNSKKPTHNIFSLNKRVETLEQENIDLKKELEGLDKLTLLVKELIEQGKPAPAPPAKQADINNTQEMTGEDAPTVRETNNLDMDEKFQVQSMINALKILSPSFLVEGKQTIANVQAVCGFTVTQEKLDKAYEKLDSE